MPRNQLLILEFLFVYQSLVQMIDSHWRACSTVAYVFYTG